MKTFIKTFFTQWLPNLVLVAALVVLIRFNLSLLAFGLIILSKWQLLIGGPKAWIGNIRDAGCDLIVALSAVSLLVLFNGDLQVQLVIAVLYLGWLIVIEHMQGTIGLAIQAGVCQLAGLSILFLLGRTLPEIVMIGLAWVVALTAADHFLSGQADPARGITALAWGLIVAEISWLLWRWLIVYSLFNGRILVPQAPLVITILGYSLGAMYIDHNNHKLRKVRLFEYLLVCLGLIAVIIFGTNWDTRL